MDEIVGVLEEKGKLIRRKKEIIHQLAGDPREPFCSALKKDLIKTEEAIFKSDEQFVSFYQQYKKHLPLRTDGEIDVGKLSDEDRVILKKIRESIREITRMM